MPPGFCPILCEVAATFWRWTATRYACPRRNVGEKESKDLLDLYFSAIILYWLNLLVLYFDYISEIDFKVMFKEVMM